MSIETEPNRWTRAKKSLCCWRAAWTSCTCVQFQCFQA